MLFCMPHLIDFLAFRAQLDPAGVAIQTPTTALTWRRSFRLVLGVAKRLRALGMQPGQVAITALRNPEVDWIVTLALFHEAAVSCSNHSVDALPPTVKPDWLITDRAREKLEAGHTVLIDSDWLSAALADSGPVEPRDYASPDSVARLVLTSGTTGRSKAVGLSIRHILGRADRGMVLRGAHTAVCTLGIGTAAALNFAVTCLVTGAPYLVGKTLQDFLDMARQHKVQGVMSTPAQLAGLVDLLERDKEPLRGVDIVRSGGGSLSRALVERIGRNITGNILALYGSTETFGMCAFKPTVHTDPATVGFAAPTSFVEVVDANGKPLPANEEGVVRVRTTDMVAGYYGDEAETARSFRDGWFYPGDRGAIDANGCLTLAGREGDMLNIGGVKIDPAPLDRLLAEAPGIKDAAVFVTTNKSGAERLAAAIVAGPDFDLPALRHWLADKQPKNGPKIVLKVDAIPRNAMGKVMRRLLTERFVR